MHSPPKNGRPTTLPESTLAYLWQKHSLKPGARLGIAISGGADSVALLRAMLELRAELGIVVSAVHFNHTLRADESEADQAFVQALATHHNLELHHARGNVAARATEGSLSIEAAARQARYEFFWSLIEGDRLDKIATAHTLDDQAETVLLRLIRGTGTRGLGGIHPELTGPAPAQKSRGTIIRPFLHTRRRDIESYLNEINQPWREDSSNLNRHHTRNRVRHSLIPLLEKDFNPEITQRLADLTEIAQADEDYLAAKLNRLIADKLLRASTLRNLPLALRRRWLRAAAPLVLQLSFSHIESILAVAEGNFADAAPNAPETCNLPEGWTFHRHGDNLAFVPPKPVRAEARVTPIATSITLPVPGHVIDPDTGRRFEALRITLAHPPKGYNPEHLYAPQALPSYLTVRTWQLGDKFWPAHTKAPKKLKELFQGKVPAESRPTWPVMTVPRDGADELIWVQGLAAPAHLRPGPSDTEAILLRETQMRETQIGTET